MRTRSPSAATRVAVAALLGALGCSQVATLGEVPDDAGDMQVEDATTASDARTDATLADPTVVLDACGPDNAAGLDEDAVQALRAGGPTPDDARLLYPYDGTVIPAGLTPPLLMWEGLEADAVRLAARSSAVAYEGCLPPTAPGQLALPEDLWNAAMENVEGDGDFLQLELTTIQDGEVQGPLRLSLVLSPAPLRGVLYYTVYGSPSLGLTSLAAVMRMPLGEAAAPFVAPIGCAGCHAASADGRTVTVTTSGFNEVYVAPMGDSIPSLAASPLMGGVEDAAVDPTGSVYVAGALGGSATPRRGFAAGPVATTLFALPSATPLDATGLPSQAVMPAFSSDGSRLAFNDATNQNAGHVLATLAFDAGQRAFSDYRPLYADSAHYPGWPSFRPDASEVVFALGERSDFGAGGVMIQNSPAPGPRSDLHLARVEGGPATMLRRAMGFTSLEDERAGRTYLPFGDEDLHQSYYPNVFPDTAGNYDWVFFDSVRHYGNQGLVRGLWCAALDADGDVDDPSHPAFFVPGQELGGASLRPVATRLPDGP